MMNFNKAFLVKGLLPIAACSALTACVDDNYDLSDIDTTSRFTVNNLTVPINLSEITLDDVVDLDDNENISKIIVDGKEVYAIQKGGDINTENFSINGIHVEAPTIPSTDVDIPIPTSVLPNMPQGTVLPNPVNIPVTLPAIPEQDYDIKLENVDKALIRLDDVKTKNPIHVEVKLQIPAGMMTGNEIAFKNLVVKMPWGLMCNDAILQAACPNAQYNQETGILTIPELRVNNNGVASLPFEANGLDLSIKNMGSLGADHRLNVNGQVGIMSGEIEFTVSTLNLPSSFRLDVDYIVSSFDIASFSGNINYEMDDISIAPISLNDLPDFLDNPETEIVIANPAILVDINNPVGKFNLQGSGSVRLTSNFDNGAEIPANSDTFVIGNDGAKLSFCTPTDGYTTVPFDGLHYILNGQSQAQGLPNSITVNLENIRFAGDAKDFPIGETFGNADGTYSFTAPLGFGNPSTVVYETSESGWGSDDLDDVNIQKISVQAFCSTNLPVGVDLQIDPIDAQGNIIPVVESTGLSVLPNSNNEMVVLEIKAKDAEHPIKGFDGVRFRAIVTQHHEDNTQAIGPDLYIKLSDLRVTVDGYYETDF